MLSLAGSNCLSLDLSNSNSNRFPVYSPKFRKVELLIFQIKNFLYHLLFCFVEIYVINSMKFKDLALILTGSLLTETNSHFYFYHFIFLMYCFLNSLDFMILSFY